MKEAVRQLQSENEVLHSENKVNMEAMELGLGDVKASLKSVAEDVARGPGPGPPGGKPGGALIWISTLQYQCVRARCRSHATQRPLDLCWNWTVKIATEAMLGSLGPLGE